jgi:hypothetical protein
MAAVHNETKEVGALINAPGVITDAAIAAGITLAYQVETCGMGALNGAMNADHAGFVAFFAVLVTHGVTNDDDSKSKAFELVMMLREGAKPSRSRALAAAGIDGAAIVTVSLTRADFLAATRIGQFPGHVLADTYWMKVHSEIRQSGQLHPASGTSRPRTIKR